MHQRTVATLQELEHCDWFRAAGHRDADGVEILSSWFEAIESCSSPDWQDLLLETANRFREHLAERSMDRFRRWNEIVLAVKPITMALVAEKTRVVVLENDLPQVFLNTVNWDILHLCMESEYADVFPPRFYASLAYWYVRGHFPCGWRGDYQAGTLVIY